MPDYRRLWVIGAGLGVARWLEFLALGVFAYQVTGSPPLVALVAIVRMLPNVFLGLVVGLLGSPESATHGIRHVPITGLDCVSVPVQREGH